MAASQEFNTPTGSVPNFGTSTPKIQSLEKYIYPVGKFNQVQDALSKVWERKEHYKTGSVSL